jgi:hypothetical protein
LLEKEGWIGQTFAGIDIEPEIMAEIVENSQEELEELIEQLAIVKELEAVLLLAGNQTRERQAALRDLILDSPIQTVRSNYEQTLGLVDSYYNHIHRLSDKLKILSKRHS